MKNILRISIALALLLNISIPAEASFIASGYKEVQDEGTPLAKRTKINFTGTGVACADSGGITVCTISSGGGGNLSDTDIDTSAELAAIVTDETGTGALVFANSPVLVTPNIGSATGSISGNAGTATALAANGANASAGNAILGVDASGAAEGAFDVWTEAENTAAAYISASSTDVLTNKTISAATNIVEADTGDSATAFFSVGTIEDARLSTNVIVAGDTLSGDVSATLEADGDTPITVSDDSHSHTTTTISGIDISADTNLAVTSPIVLTDDTLSLNQNAGTDVTADLEEETHATEHAIGGADTVEFYGEIQDEDTPLTRRRLLNFEGAGVSCADDTTKTTCTIPGAGSATITVEEGDVTVSAAISDLDFGSGFDVTESPAGEANIVMDLSENVTGDVTFNTSNVSTIGADSVALSTDTTGNYAAGDAEAGNALTGDSATAFFSTGTLEDARLSTNVIVAGDTFSGDVTGTLEADGDTPLTIASNSVALTTDTTGDYVASLVAGLAIDVSAAGEGATPTIDFDPTELTGSRTWSDGSTNTIVWTWNRLSGTDPTLTFSDADLLKSNIQIEAPTLHIGGTGLLSAADFQVARFFSGGTQATDGAVKLQGNLTGTPTASFRLFNTEFNVNPSGAAGNNHVAFNTSVGGSATANVTGSVTGYNLNFTTDFNANTLSTAYGMKMIMSPGSGTFTEAFGLHITLTNGGGSVGSGVGIYIADSTAVDYSIFTEVGSAVFNNQLDDFDFTVNGDTRSSIIFVDGSTDSLQTNGRLVTQVDARTIDDTGDANPATLTLAPLTSFVRITCNDADTCDVTMSETGVINGQKLVVTNITANVVDFADTSGVTELSGAFAMGQYDSIELQYDSDRWIEIGRSDN